MTAKKNPSILICFDCKVLWQSQRPRKCGDGKFRCRKCRHKAYRQTKRYIEYNKQDRWKEYRREYGKKYRQTDKEKERIRRKNEKYKQDEKWKEHIREYGKKYRQTENGKQNARKKKKKYRQSAKGKETEKAYRKTEVDKECKRRSKKKRYWKDPKYHTVKIVARRHGCYIDLLKKILERDKICQHCSTEENLSFDHIIPVSKGGKAIEDNLQILCRSCNSRKGATIPCA